MATEKDTVTLYNELLALDAEVDAVIASATNKGITIPPAIQTAFSNMKTELLKARKQLAATLT